GLSKNSRISLTTRTLLGRTGTDVNSQLLLKLYTEDAAEARGWLPGGQLHSDLLVLLRVYLGWRYQALIPALSIRNRESMTHVSYSF
ncbi:type VI secretion system baseplate subunit TssG, partial [Escherichia coli]